MKYLKKYEIVKHLSEINKNELEIGDYILLKMWSDYNSELVNFVNNNIGQISDMTSLKISVTINYENVPPSIQKHFSKRGNNIFSRSHHINEIEYHSKNKEELEIVIAANKYNI